MELTHQHAQSLCHQLMASLVNQGPALLAALQAAGCERKMEGWIQQGMKQWLSENAPKEDGSRVCLTEYRGIDFVFLMPGSIGQETLSFDTLFEAKFNYTSQAGELNIRPIGAAEQLRGYMAHHKVRHGYFLYILADHSDRAGALPTSNRGWQYIGQAVPGRFVEGIQAMQTSATGAGFASLATAAAALSGWQLHLELFELPPEMARHESASI